MSCTPVALPAVKADFCAPDLNFGQIDKIYLGNEGQPLTDWTDLTEWNNRLDNEDVTADNDKIRMLHVIGDKPLPERNSVDFSQGRKAYTTPTHTVNIKVDETHDDNYAFVQWLDANVGQTIKVWYQAGKYLYGGNEGISATVVLGDVIPESDEELNTFEGSVEWKGDHPARTANPMA